MDRFIVTKAKFVTSLITLLKSNMDRFIAKVLLTVLISEIFFKIQYG